MQYVKKPKPMSASEFRHALDALAWTQGDAASRYGISLRTSARYAAGEAKIPVATAADLRRLVHAKLESPRKFDELMQAL